MISESFLAAWLLRNGFAEESAGYGHVDATTLARALLTRFQIDLRIDFDFPEEKTDWRY